VIYDYHRTCSNIQKKAVIPCSVSQKYRLLLREVLRERFLRETKKGLFAA